MQGTAIFSVVIPVFNGRDTIGRCLDAVYKSDLKDLEVIVVDDGSTDETAEIVGSYPCRLIQTKTNCGAASARNLGAANANAPLIYFLDSDILLRPDTLSSFLKAFETRPDVSAVFGSFEKDTVHGNFASVYKNLLHHYTHQLGNEDATTFCGGFSAIRREAFLAVGGFDTSYRAMEDVEFGYRLHRAGYRVWLRKDLQTTHLKKLTLAALVRTDVFDRAVPWTAIMLEKKVFRNDLNTRANNVASVPLAILIPASLVGPRPGPWIGLFLILLLVGLNRDFLDFLRRERGWWFATRGAAFCWFGYVYSGLGALLGAVRFAKQRLTGRTIGESIRASSRGD